MPRKKYKSAAAPPYALGEPPRPKGLTRPTANAWKKLCEELMAVRKLAQSDGPKLRDWIQARADQYKATGERREAGRKRASEIAAQFEARPPFPEEPVVSAEKEQ